MSQTIQTQKSKIKNAEHVFNWRVLIRFLLFVSRGCIFLKLESELHFSIISIQFLVSNNQKKILHFLGKNGKNGQKPGTRTETFTRCFPKASPHESPYQRVAAVERLAPVERRPELCLPGSQTFGQISIFIGCIFQQILECCDVVVVVVVAAVQCQKALSSLLPCHWRRRCCPFGQTLPDSFSR